ncbi:CMF_collapsed_G0000210.mRNA.1.CDS.1 [Saccharomyces cerevisiae]|nr:CMF_collapsed_G0000210.mRNA.1.CDS.1 [Saccharomyces cerevisiae]
MAGEAVSEHTPDSQEVTVTSVVCCLDSVVEIGHHVVYFVVTPLIVAVLVDTMAGEAVLEHTSDSQEEIVTTVVCFVVSVVCSVVPLVCFVVSVVEIGHHVVYSVVTPLTVTVAVETIAGEMDSVHT